MTTVLIRTRRALVVPALIAVALLAGCAAGPSTLAPADMLVRNARIATLDGRSTVAEAMAIGNGRILAVGSAAHVARYSGPNTRQIDAGGRTVIPGLIDSHIHAIRAGLTFSTEVNWIGTTTIAEALDRVRDAVRRGPPGKWIVVAGGWAEEQFAEKRRPTEAELAAAAPDNPVYIQLHYRAVLLTPKAREQLGISLDAPPARTTAQRDAAGRFTGWLHGNNLSITPIFDKLPQATYADNIAGTKLFFRELNRLAITGVSDPGGFNVSAPQYAPMFDLWRQKQLTLRMRYSLFAQTPGKELDDFKNLTQLLPMGFGDDMLRFAGVGERITIAAYDNDTPNEEVRQKLYESLRWAAGRGMTVTYHWRLDKSVHQLLDLFERVNREVPIAPLRWSIAHLHDGSPETLARMARMGVGWTMQDYMYFSGDREIEERGQAGVQNMPPIVTGIQAGVNVGASTDAHRANSYNPFTNLQWMLDGLTVGGRSTRVAAQIPTREQALRLYTLGSAWFSFEEKERGSLEPGKLADFAVLDRDYFSVPVSQIGKTASLLTVVGGQVVYAAAPFSER